MEIINMQCTVSLKYIEVFESCLFGRAYIHRRSANAILVEMYDY